MKKTNTILNVLLWIAQLMLSATFLWAAYMKFLKPQELPFPWVKDNPTLVVVSGVADLLGGLGIVLPMLLRIQPRLTVFAAYGIILLMLVASAFHISRGEANAIGFNVLILALAAFVAWGRR